MKKHICAILSLFLIVSSAVGCSPNAPDVLSEPPDSSVDAGDSETSYASVSIPEGDEMLTETENGKILFQITPETLKTALNQKIENISYHIGEWEEKPYGKDIVFTYGFSEGITVSVTTEEKTGLISAIRTVMPLQEGNNPYMRSYNSYIWTQYMVSPLLRIFASSEQQASEMAEALELPALDDWPAGHTASTEHAGISCLLSLDSDFLASLTISPKTEATNSAVVSSEAENSPSQSSKPSSANEPDGSISSQMPDSSKPSSAHSPQETPSSSSSPSQSSAPSQEKPSQRPSGQTVSQKNAVDKAKSYLRIFSFSRDGLIHQLEFDGYSHTDAVYGADHCGADWNQQALRKAKSYLETFSFSYEGLLDQLAFDAFTAEQAAYGVKNCGADWNEQAVKKAESYLEIFDFSREELISQLEYDGFTHEQAIYGAEKNGL